MVLFKTTLINIIKMYFSISFMLITVICIFYKYYVNLLVITFKSV